MDFHINNTKEGRAAGNSRNEYGKKTLKSNFGQFELATPRDRHSTFEPQIIPKRSTKSAMLEEAILSLYAKGMTTRDIKATLQDLYHVDISPSLISKVTDVVKDVFVFCVDGLTGFPDTIKEVFPKSDIHWERSWENIITIFTYLAEIRRVIMQLSRSTE